MEESKSQPIDDQGVFNPIEKKFVFELDNVSFCFPKQNEIIFEKMSLKIKSGDITAIVGRSGTGKSTFLDILLGYNLPQSGNCFFKGEKISGPETTRFPVPQEDGTWPWLTAFENVMLPFFFKKGGGEINFSAQQEASKILNLVGIEKNDFKKLPKQLSSGMKKRVEIARALFAKPRAILADEPFGNLDVIIKNDLYQIFIEIIKNFKSEIIFTTHDIEEALFLAKTIIVFKKSGNEPVAAKFFNNEFAFDKTAKIKNPEDFYCFREKIIQEF